MKLWLSDFARWRTRDSWWRLNVIECWFWGCVDVARFLKHRVRLGFVGEGEMNAWYMTQVMYEKTRDDLQSNDRYIRTLKFIIWMKLPRIKRTQSSALAACFWQYLAWNKLVRRNGRTSTAAPLPATGRSTQRNAPSGQPLPSNFKAPPLQFMTLGNVVHII